MLRFKRTFGAGPDIEPTPTASNNYQSASVMNGSYIHDFVKKITILSQESVPNTGARNQLFKLDVYQIALSFYEAHYWEDFQTQAGQNALVNQETTGDTAGEVTFDGSTISSKNTILNSKYTQHYLRYLGTVEISAGEQKELIFNYIPTKCRRSNNGMFWGIVLHLDANENNSSALGS